MSSFLRAPGMSSKEDDTSTTFQHCNGHLNGLSPKSRPSKIFSSMDPTSQQRKIIETDQFPLHTDSSNLALHMEKLTA